MPHLHIHPAPKSLYLLLCFLFFVSGCKVKLVADYDAELAEQIETTYKKIHAFYLSMAETKADSIARNYNLFSSGYIDIETDLTSMYYKNQIRPLNKHSEAISKIAVDYWKDYKNEHKRDGWISNGVITLNLNYMNDVFYAMYVAEKAKELINENEN